MPLLPWLQLHRRTLIDDGFGAGEALNETGSDHKGLIVRSKVEIKSSYTPHTLSCYPKHSPLLSPTHTHTPNLPLFKDAMLLTMVVMW